jgi:hypothetical protein
MIDMGAKYHGFCSDVTRTFFFDGATTEMYDAYLAVLSAEMGVIEAIAPGVAVRDLDHIVGSALSDYEGEEGVTGLTYWGHGVGRWVHTEPLLWSGSDAVLQEGDIVAVEPGLYFEDGWAVRVEDTVLVTDTGYEILSNLPRDLDDVIISSANPYVLADFAVSDYHYGLETEISLSLSSSYASPISQVELFDGHSWRLMDPDNTTIYSISYQLDYSYSSRLRIIARVNISGVHWFFSEEMHSTATASEHLPLDPAIDATIYTEPPESPLLWSITCPNASMIRVLFDVLDAPLFDQFLIMDSSGRVIMDYRGLHEKLHWSEWIAGDEFVVRIAASDSPLFGGVGDFRVRIDTIEVIYGAPTITTTTTKPTFTTTTTESTSTTSTNSGTGAPNRLYFGLQVGFAVSATMILVAYWVLRKRN